jgi:predicted alpha/beta-hydrolase family hydrolase
MTLIAACSAPTEPGSVPMSASAAATVPASSTAPSTGEASETASGPYREITLELPNGSLREGRDYGNGEVGIVLTHMGGATDTQDDWADLAEELVAEGYRVVTFNHNASAVWVQVLAATDYLREQGATTVVAGGASLGAMASLRAAQEPGSGLHGVIWIAGVQLGSGYAFREEDVGAVACPILFASGTGDEHGAAEDAERMSAWAPSAELVLVESDLHGTDILLEGGPAADTLRAAILGFLEGVRAAPTRCG